MKASRTLIVLMLLNLAVFAGIVVYLLETRISAPLSPASENLEHRDASASAGRPNVPAPPLPVMLNEPDGTNEFHWGQLESEDYKTYVARLRAIGCPEQTLRDIIIADLDKLLAPEFRTALGRRKELKYWEPEEEEMANDVDPGEVVRKERELDKRKREIIRELVGADLSRERMKASGQEDYYERRLKFLPEGQRTRVRELLERFDEAEQEIRSREELQEGGLSGADRAQLRMLREQRTTELAKLLNPDEKHLYELWLSPLANQIRHATYGMNASEEEFLGIYQARAGYEATWGLREAELLDENSRQQLQLAQQQMETQIKELLGEERYAQYVRGSDDDFHLLSGLVTRFQLPKEKASEVYGYKNVAMTYRAEILSNPSLPPQQREAALQAIKEETRKSVRDALGPKAYNYYLRTGQAQWMQ